MAKRENKLLAITYPGYEDERYLNTCSPSHFERQWQKYQSTLQPSKEFVPFSPKPKRWLSNCASAAWSSLKMCFYCCLALIFLVMLETSCSSQFNTEALNRTLRQNVIGQNFAVELTVSAVSDYLKSNDFSFPLVLVFVGCSGCGKTYTMSLISGTYPLATELVVSHHVMPAQLSNVDVGKEILKKLTSWRTNVITIDDIALNNIPLCYQLSNLFSEWETYVAVKTKPTILILSLSISAVVEDYAVSKLKTNEQILSELQNEYKQLLPRWMDRFQVVPFVPMRKEHVAQCIRKELENWNESFSEEFVENILNEMHFYPVENPTFSDSGCKAVPIKSALGKFRRDHL